jgi:hypothetical protein
LKKHLLPTLCALALTATAMPALAENEWIDALKLSTPSLTWKKDDFHISLEVTNTGVEATPDMIIVRCTLFDERGDTVGIVFDTVGIIKPNHRGYSNTRTLGAADSPKRHAKTVECYVDRDKRKAF